MSFGTALSGINAATSDLNVISNNIANNNTTAFKSSRAEFADLTAQVVAGNLGAGNTAIGTGVQLADVTQLFTQGSLSFTGNPLDMAINGQGFFRMNDNGGIVYTRSGVFGVDRDGYVVNRANQRLTGFLADATGELTNTLGDIRLTTNDFPPKTTTETNIALNLDANSAPPLDNNGVNLTIDPEEPRTYNNSTSITIYDSQGTAHTMTVLFQKDDSTPNTWNLAVSVDGTATTGVNLSTSTLTFTPQGGINTPQPITASIDLGATSGADTPMRVDLDFSGTTQFGSPFGINELNQDGFASGRLTGVEIDESGVLFARYTNGQSQAVAQVALTNFKNPSGLQQAGASAWAESFTSGPPLTGKPGTGTFGLIQSGALESSNVELTDQLVAMIRAQRNFQANAQVLSTNDQLTQTIINLR
jgi:flagellar hook protein FlgE